MCPSSLLLELVVIEFEVEHEVEFCNGEHKIEFKVGDLRREGTAEWERE